MNIPIMGLKNSINNTNNNLPLKDHTDKKAPLPANLLEEIQHNKDANVANVVGSNQEAEKIDKKLVNKNAFCAKNCFDNNQNAANSKKCYLNGVVKNCFSCKFREAARTETEINIEKICMNFCNHVDNTPDCLYFGYTNKNKKQIDIDSKILIDFGIKKSNKKLKN